MLRHTMRGHKLFVSADTPTDIAINRFQCFLYRHRPLTCHGLRHTTGLDGHAACRHVTRLLGHERENVTRIYLASLRKWGEPHD